jgi:hypothetical protein
MASSTTTVVVHALDGALTLTFEPGLSPERYETLGELIQFQCSSKRQISYVLKTVALSWGAKCSCQDLEAVV